MWVMPVMDAATIRRGKWAHEPATIEFLKRLKTHIDNPEFEAQPAVPENICLNPTIEDLQGMKEEFNAADAVSLDIENAGEHIICVGLAPVNFTDDSVGIKLVLRFRSQGGDLYWQSWEEHVAAVQWLYDLLANEDVGKIMHNGVAHDVPELERLGFEFNGEIIDTMVMAHAVYSEFPKGLQFCATLYCGAPVWKAMLDAKDELDGKS